jgi:hypothetical protein
MARKTYVIETRAASTYAIEAGFDALAARLDVHLEEHAG